MDGMWVSVRGSSTVKPADETWNGSLPLSEWDQVGSVAHVPTIYFYKAPPQNWLTILRDSLSRLLVHFYPFAGRLRSIGGGRMVLLCNAEGVELIEAQSDAQLEDFGDRFENLIPCPDYERPIHELPLLLVQLTRFSCGSISIAITMSHVVADGTSCIHFFAEWARLARGEPLGAAPFLDRMVLQNRSNINQAPTTFDDDDMALMFGRPPLLIGETSDRVERKKAIERAVLKLTINQVEALKKLAANYENGRGHGAYYYSRYEVITAHAWKCACKARRHESAQPTALGLCIDVRRLMIPPLPANYFGNAIVDVVVRSRSGEILSKPLGFACSRIREAIERVTDDYVNAATRFLKNQSDLSRFQYDRLKGVATSELEEDEGPFFGNPNVAFSTWVNLPIHGIDFGWGKEINMAPGYDDFDGGFLLLPSREGDGSILVSVCLQVPHIDAFKKFFYEDIQPSKQHVHDLNPKTKKFTIQMSARI